MDEQYTPGVEHFLVAKKILEKPSVTVYSKPEPYATILAARAQLEIAQGSAASMLEAQKRLTRSIEVSQALLSGSLLEAQTRLSSSLAALNTANQQAEETLHKWTKVQGWSAIALVLFTLAQVVIAIVQFSSSAR